MVEYLTNDTDLKKVADAIRTKGGTADPLVYPDGFAEAIGNIQTGSPEQEKSVTITANGTTEITPDEGKLLNKVTVGVDVPDWETWVFNEELSNISQITSSRSFVVSGEIVVFSPDDNAEIVVRNMVIRVVKTKFYIIGFTWEGGSIYVYKNQEWINPLCRKIRIRKGYEVNVPSPLWDLVKPNIAIQNSNIAIQPSKTVKSSDMVNFPYEIEPDPPFDGIAKVIITAD